MVLGHRNQSLLFRQEAAIGLAGLATVDWAGSLSRCFCLCNTPFTWFEEDRLGVLRAAFGKPDLPYRRGRSMRTSEWIQSGFAVIVAVAAWSSPLTARRRITVTLLAGFVIVAVALARLSECILAPFQVSILRDWLPVPLMLVPYWQTGQFFSGPDEKIQAWLVNSDRWLLNRVSRTGFVFGRISRLTMEWAYMLCYPLVPLGLATLDAAGLRRFASVYWFFVLVPTYLCYVITPFVPALPPRSLGSARAEPCSTKSRIFNLWILKHGSIQAVTFPSGHVAASLAVSLVILQYLPLMGAIFLALTVWIAVAAVAGGYHYAIDVVLGAAMTFSVYLAWRAHLIPSTLIMIAAMALVAPL
jgi:membrane-associated phospholipid phosphatase